MNDKIDEIIDLIFDWVSNAEISGKHDGLFFEECNPNYGYHNKADMISKFKKSNEYNKIKEMIENES